MKTQNTPITESTVLQNTPKVKKEESNHSLWQSVLVGGVPGILIGARVSSAFAQQPDAGIEPVDEQDENMESAPQEVAEIQVAHSVTDDMSFSEAFAAARNEVGPGGAFVWHGNVYGTYRADDPEWQGMSDEARAEYGEAVVSQVHPAPYTMTSNEPEIVEAPMEEVPVVDSANADDSKDEDVDVHIVGVAQGQTDNGTTVTVGYGTVEGHYAEFVDSDGDGEVDTVLIDENDNQVLDEGEVHGMAPGVTVEDLVAEAQANTAAEVDEALYGDMPDYTNDADTSSFI